MSRLFITLLLSCYVASVQADTLSSKHKKELTIFSFYALGVRPNINQLKILSMPEIKEMVATGINMNGLLCAQITSISPLRVDGAYEVTCIAYSGGQGRKTYIINSKNGEASEL